jgi:hypothetical protein
MKGEVVRLELPSRSEVLGRLQGLIDGAISAEEIEAWAEHWVLWDEIPGNVVATRDWAVWQTLKVLAGANLPNLDRTPLHSRHDFQAWADELKSAP